MMTMAKTDLTIDVHAKLSVDRKTAETCLKLVEIFCNANGISVLGHRDENHYTTFEFETKHSSTGISRETAEALNAIGRNTHVKEADKND